MNVIHRQVLELADKQTLKIKGFRKILQIREARDGEAFGAFEIWYTCDPQFGWSKSVNIYIAGTGHPVDKSWDYITTCMTNGGNFVWHFFTDGEWNKEEDNE